jgi:hypothetical protein
MSKIRRNVVLRLSRWLVVECRSGLAAGINRVHRESTLYEVFQSNPQGSFRSRRAGALEIDTNRSKLRSSESDILSSQHATNRIPVSLHACCLLATMVSITLGSPGLVINPIIIQHFGRNDSLLVLTFTESRCVPVPVPCGRSIKPFGTCTKQCSK